MHLDLRRIRAFGLFLGLMLAASTITACDRDGKHKTKRGGQSQDAVGVEGAGESGASDASAGADGADGAGSETPAGDDAGTDASDGGADATSEAPGLSRRANLRFKRQALIESDLARGLELDPAEICKELGQLSCLRSVHNLTLGGIDPYESGINSGIAESMPTTPIAFERVALSACVRRVARDFDAPGNAVIFRGLDVDAAGHLADPAAPSVAASLDTLYQRILSREVSAAEVAHYRGLYADVRAISAGGAAREWATLACYVALTTVEAAFY